MTCSVPLRTSTVAVGPPGSTPDSITLPLAWRLGFAFNSSKSAWSKIISSNLSTPCLVSAEHSTKMVSPPQSSGTSLVLQLLAHLQGVGIRVITLVDGDQDRNLRRTGVVQGLQGLGHDAIIGSDDQDNDVRDVRPAGTHGTECRVAGRVQEGNLGQLSLPFGVGDGNRISTNMLGDPTGIRQPLHWPSG